MTLQHLLAGLTEFSRRNARAVVLAGFFLACLSAAWSTSHLGVSTDTDAMFAAHLPWRQQAMAFDRAFPQFRDLLVAVVEADSPEAADATAAGLAAALAAQPGEKLFVRRPDASPFLARAGLLFLDKEALNDLLEHTIDAQPFLGQLSADPSARGLFSALGLLGQGVVHAQANLAPFTPALEAFHRTMASVMGASVMGASVMGASALAGKPEPLSWSRLLGGNLLDLGSQARFVLIQANLDFGALEPGAATTSRVRAAIAGLEFVRAGQARVRITGAVALADEEFATVAEGAAAGFLVSLALITLWLFLAVRGWRLIVPILLTLAVGLAFTLGFAALAVGTLNLVSVGFGILFVGIAVDFAIQFSVRYREASREFSDPADAMRVVTERTGGAILIAALATAAGFLAFVPTDFSGVAELGLIAGVGMLIAFVCTLVFLPAVITLCRPPGEMDEIGFRWAMWLDPILARHRGPLLGIFAAIAMLGATLIPRIGFDSDPLHTKNPNTEAMRTLRDLMASPLTNPYSLDIFAPDPTQAAALAARLRALPLVEEVLSIDSFVPPDQPEKLAAIADAAALLGPSLARRDPAAPVTAADIRLAAQTALAPLDAALEKLPKTHPIAAIAADLRALITAPDATLLATNTALIRYLPAQLEQLRAALAPQPVTREDIPPEISRDWLTPDGRARVQVLGKPSAREAAGLEALVAQIRTVAPEAGGPAVTIVESAATITSAFRAASLWALAAITLLLLITLRRVLDTALVLAPLLLSALLTVIVIVLARIDLNFANIIALPLLLGVGVSFNIYFVMNFRLGRPRVLGSATARAIVFSALTTGSAFGSLAASRHPGTASMGLLLLISLACTLVASLVFIPALLATLRGPK